MVPYSGDEIRYGMNKNWRVGKIVYVSKRNTTDGSRSILVNVHEYCIPSLNKTSDYYISNYNLWMVIPKGVKNNITVSEVGKTILVGFYIQSFRDKDHSEVYNTVLQVKSIEIIPDSRMEIIGKRICHSILLFNPNTI